MVEAVQSAEPSYLAAGWPRAQTRAPSTPFDPQTFVTLPDVPVFAEHETEAKDGRKLRFSYNELKAVCDRCNRRISETGDYAGVTVGHTPDPDSDKEMPDLVGLAGPFKMGLLGNPGSRQRYAILADLHVYRDQLERVKRHPRRSPELWLEDKFEDMFLDPIALLGAEPPRLDMGLLYSANYHGRMTHKYTAVAPSSGNVFAANFGDDDDKPCRKYDAAQPHQPQAGGIAMLTPDDIGQIVDALEQLDWVQAVKADMAAKQGNNASIPGQDGPPPEAPPAAGAPPVDPMAAAPPAPPAPPVPPVPDSPPPAPPAPPTPPAPHKEPDGDEAAATPPPPADASTPPEAPPSGEEPEKLGAMPRKYSASEMDDMDDDEFEEYSRQRSRRRRKHYEAGGSVDDPDEGKPSANASVDPEKQTLPDGDVDPDGEGESNFTPSGGGDESTEKYSLRHARRDMEKLKGELDKTRKQLANERATRTDAERYTRLQGLRSRFAFELDEEFTTCKYGAMSDEQFAKHLQRIEANYRPIPVDYELTIADDIGAVTMDRPGGKAERARYSKQLSEQARTVCEAKALRGEVADYAQVLEALHRGEAVA